MSWPLTGRGTGPDDRLTSVVSYQLLELGWHTPSSDRLERKETGLVYFRAMPLAILDLVDLSDPPQVKIDIPLVRLGDTVRLAFSLKRQHLGRSEVLAVSGEYKVMHVVLDTTRGSPCQIVQVASTGKSPSWVAVKSSKPEPKTLAPARFKRTLVQ